MHLRMKVGDHEFECDATFEEVQRRYAEWRTLLRESDPCAFVSLPLFSSGEHHGHGVEPPDMEKAFEDVKKKAASFADSVWNDGAQIPRHPDEVPVSR